MKDRAGVFFPWADKNVEARKYVVGLHPLP